MKRLLEFKWKDLVVELDQKAPVLSSILKAASQCTRSKETSTIGTLMSAGILLKHRNQQMGLLQTMVAIFLYTGHAAKKVSFGMYCQSYT